MLATCLEMLTRKYGITLDSHLSKEQKEDLVAFLKSLPFEMPPDETPNTVPYRFIEKAKSEEKKE